MDHFEALIRYVDGTRRVKNMFIQPRYVRIGLLRVQVYEGIYLGICTQSCKLHSYINICYKFIYTQEKCLGLYICKTISSWSFHKWKLHLVTEGAWNSMKFILNISSPCRSLRGGMNHQHRGSECLEMRCNTKNFMHWKFISCYYICGCNWGKEPCSNG